MRSRILKLGMPKAAIDLFLVYLNIDIRHSPVQIIFCIYNVIAIISGSCQTSEFINKDSVLYQTLKLDFLEKYKNGDRWFWL